METIRIKDEYIRLGQALKLAGLVGSGVDAKNSDCQSNGTDSMLG